jgi:hypothetical protein
VIGLEQAHMEDIVQSGANAFQDVEGTIEFRPELGAPLHLK